MKIQRRVEAIDFKFRDIFDENIEFNSVVDSLIKTRDKINQDFPGCEFKLNLDCNGADIYDVQIQVWRLETDEEEQQRLQKEQKFIDAQKDREIEEYKKIKAKYNL